MIQAADLLGRRACRRNPSACNDHPWMAQLGVARDSGECFWHVGMVGAHLPAMRGKQGVQLVHRPDPGLCQVRPPLVLQADRIRKLSRPLTAASPQPPAVLPIVTVDTRPVMVAARDAKTRKYRHNPT
jgi:hypothetical protein